MKMACLMSSAWAWHEVEEEGCKPFSSVGWKSGKGEKRTWLPWARQEWIHLFKYLLHRSFLGLQTLVKKSILSDKFFLCMGSSLSHSRATASLSFSCRRGKTCKQRISMRLNSDIQPAGNWLLHLSRNKGSIESCPSFERRTILLPSVQDWPVSLPPSGHCCSAGGRALQPSAGLRWQCAGLQGGCGAGLDSSRHTFAFTGQLFENVQIALSSSKSTRGLLLGISLLN